MVGIYNWIGEVRIVYFKNVSLHKNWWDEYSTLMQNAAINGL